MIRIIMKCKIKEISGLEREDFYTFETECNELEKAICSGGCGENAYESHELIGVEIIKNK